MNKPTTYIVRGKQWQLLLVRKDLYKYYHIRTFPPVDGKLRVIIKDAAELSLLQEACFDAGVSYSQE